MLEWDSEIEEFLPAVTEDNLQVLTRAGESGDQSPTPTSVLSDVQNGITNCSILLIIALLNTINYIYYYLFYICSVNIYFIKFY